MEKPGTDENETGRMLAERVNHIHREEYVGQRNASFGYRPAR